MSKWYKVDREQGVGCGVTTLRLFRVLKVAIAFCGLCCEKLRQCLKYYLKEVYMITISEKS
ncbi:MAG: hypothetical protein SAL70_16305 [Scytonema sp. PMC 1070.18]|nr:hypothetical protein [Scytonema sp. PMC 1070.18]